MREGLLRFYVLVVPVVHSEERDETQPLSFYTFNEAELEKDFDIEKFRLDDVFPDRGESVAQEFPPMEGAVAYCHVNRSLILAGGSFLNVSGEVTPTEPRVWRTITKCVWSLDVAAATRLPGRRCSTWRICANMHHSRKNQLVVPYDGQIFIFGGETSSEPPTLEIYDPKSRKLSEPKPLHEDLSSEVATPHSYFLWKDSSAPHKKPLVMMHYDHRVPPYRRLWSYNVEDGSLQVFDADFPASKSVLLPLDGRSDLLIFDEPSQWSVYDMSSKKVTGQLEVQGLEKSYRGVRRVRHAFCRHCSDASVIVYLFIEEQERHYEYSIQLPCAKVRLRMKGGKLSAALESEVALQTGQHQKVYMFAEQATVEATPDLGGQKA